MKRGTPRHPKVTDLSARLKITHYAAVGLLEMLWHFAAEFCHAGDVGRFSDEAISKALCWDGTSSKLISSLTDSGWLDVCECHRLRIHDWPDHADQTVERVLKGRGQSFLPCYDNARMKLEGDEKKLASLSLKPIPIPSPPTKKTLKPKKISKLTASQKELADRFEFALDGEWINDSGKWINRIKDDPDKCRRVVAEVENAIREGRIRSVPAAYAEDQWKQFA